MRLESGRQALVLVARGDSRKGAGLLGYFFGPYDEPEPATTARCASLTYEDAVQVRVFRHDGIQDASWPLVERIQEFDRGVWPNPVLGNPGAGYRSIRDDDAPNREAAVLPAEPGDEDLPPDGYAGSVYMELVLDQRTTEDPSRPRIVPATSVNIGSPPAAPGRPEQAVLLHFIVPPRGTKGWQRDVEDLEGVLAEAVERSGVGEFDGIERDGKELVFYLYGPDADRLWRTVETLVSTSKARPAYALLRPGGPDVKPRRIDLAGNQQAEVAGTNQR